MKDLECPKIPNDTKLKDFLKPELSTLIKCRIIALLSTAFILAIIFGTILNFSPIGLLYLVPLFGALIYHEHKQYVRANDVLILKRFMNDPEFKEWYSRVHLKVDDDKRKSVENSN